MEKCIRQRVEYQRQKSDEHHMQTMTESLRTDPDKIMMSLSYEIYAEQLKYQNRSILIVIVFLAK